MPNIRVRNFSGMIPALDPKLLPNENAAFCENCKLDTGTLRAYGKPYNGELLPYAAEIAADPTYNTFFFGVPQSQYPLAIRGLRKNIFRDNINGINIDTNERVFSVSSGVLRASYSRSPSFLQIGVPAGPRVFMNGVNSALRSTHQMARTYCATYVNQFGEEGGIGQTTGEFTCFEGDTVNLLLLPSIGGQTAFGLKKIRIYRSLSPYTTGEELSNKFDTDYHLVDEIDIFTDGVITYNDTLASDAIPGDLLLSKEFFMPQVVDAICAAELESGYIAIAYPDGRIKLSERFLAHAYPLRNEIMLPTSINAMVVNRNIIYATSQHGAAYRIIVTPEAAGPKFDVRQYPDYYICKNPRSLVRTDAGAMFSSQRGLVALTPETQTLITQNWIHPEIWNRDYSPSKGAWLNGYYFGVGPAFAWLMDVRDIASEQNRFGKLTTVSTELLPYSYTDTLASYFPLDDKVVVAFDRQIRYWDGLERDAGRTVAYYAPYLWRSKTFVQPARMTYAAAKVTFASGQALPGELTFKLYGDGILKYERPVFTDEPFRLPHLYKSLNWYFELVGTAEVHEVHIATSMDDLGNEPL